MKKKQKPVQPVSPERLAAEKFLKAIKEMPYSNDRVGQIFVRQTNKKL